MTIQEQLPGLNVHINEGRVTGTFELPPADMQHIRYQGRVVLVLVADAMAISVKDTKDGDTKASWTFKGVDAAIVSDPNMVDHLGRTLYLDGLSDLDAPVPVSPGKGMVGVYSDEGQFLGFQEPDEPRADPETGEIPNYYDRDEQGTGEDGVEAAPLEAEEPNESGTDEDDRVFRVTTNRPIQNGDPLLERFLNDRVSSGI